MSAESSFVWTTLGTVSVSAILLAAVAWLTRSIITHWLSRDVELYRAGLQKELESFRASLLHENTRELERLRVDLQKVAIEHQVRYSKMHEKVFDTIAQVYGLIVRAHSAMADYIKPFVPAGDAPETIRGREAADAWSALNNFFKSHEIYFDSATSELMRKYIDELQDLFLKFQNREYEKSKTRAWQAVWDKLNQDLTRIKRTLEGAFRRKIGIENTIDIGEEK